MITLPHFLFFYDSFEHFRFTMLSFDEFYRSNTVKQTISGQKFKMYHFLNFQMSSTFLLLGNFLFCITTTDIYIWFISNFRTLLISSLFILVCVLCHVNHNILLSFLSYIHYGCCINSSITVFLLLSLLKS